MRKNCVIKLKRVLIYLMIFCFIFGGVDMSFAQENSNSQGAKIICGPYLLAPKSDSMTVVWETDEPVDAWLWYGTEGKITEKVAVAYNEGVPFEGEKTFIYRGILKNLKPNTQYQYRVELKTGTKEEGIFKTLSEKPEEIQFVVISDTHKFETEKKFEEKISELKPDFILHTGDILEGTGLQKDQFGYWLKQGAEFLKNIPVIYASGNHDDGPYFDDYFTFVQSKSFHSDSTGRNIAFNYGDVHFIMMNSCPWGLYEMNAVTAGNKVDDKTQKQINDSIKWLIEDLNSEPAKTANFRIIGMHHPYSDDFTQKNIVDAVEKYNVNLMFTGHLHTYYRNVSAEPNRGARTVYVSQGDGRLPDGKMSYGKEGERIDPKFPEVVAEGQADFVNVIVKGNELKYETYGTPKNEKDFKIFDPMTLYNEEPKLSYSNISITPDEILSNGTVNVNATVKNEGKGIAAAVMNVYDNDKLQTLYLFGQQGKERVVVLNPGESKELSGKITLQSLGNHVLKFSDYKKTVKVVFRPATFEYANTKFKMGMGEQGDVLFIKAEVENIGNEKGVKEVPLYVNDKVVSTKKIELKPSEKQVVEFTYKFEQWGSYNVHIADLTPQKIDIEGILKGTPIVKDLSGKGNNGLLRGAPILAEGEKGLAVDLDGVDDYIEIPDSKSLRINQGITGMVWSNIDRLAKDNENDHNPLIVKGPSISYGVNYLYRMALRRTGQLTYGVGFNDANGEFFWNDGANGGAQIGKWAQYTGAFDKNIGGVSYLNGVKVGEIEAPPYDTELSEWEGHPFFIGYSYHKHLLKNRGRGKYYTLLDGKIGQVRIYNVKLTEQENKYILENPEKTGPKAENLIVWLNFKDIETKGKHVTEWQKPIPLTTNNKSDKQTWSFKNLHIDSKISGKAAIKAIVEVSDDGVKVKDSKEIVLKGGLEEINIASMKKGQFIRIVTEMNSVISKEGTFVPEIREYKVTASNEFTNGEAAWSTKNDWEKGTFEGAVGFESMDKFVNYEEDLKSY